MGQLLYELFSIKPNSSAQSLLYMLNPFISDFFLSILAYMLNILNINISEKPWYCPQKWNDDLCPAHVRL